jgi:hypothetical protein
MVSWVDEAGRTERRDNIHFCSLVQMPVRCYGATIHINKPEIYKIQT